MISGCNALHEKLRGEKNKLNELVIATSNRNKFVEICAVLSLPGVVIRSLSDFPGIPDAPEEGSTFADIARGKALFYFSRILNPVLAEDSGLVIPGLDGYPGIYSARVAPDDPSRIALVLQKLKGQKGEKRSAHYVCSMAYADGKHLIEAEGRCEGLITEAPEGSGGFGYDPIFCPEGLSITFAGMDPAEKNHYSHRGRALRQLIPRLQFLSAH